MKPPPTPPSRPIDRRDKLEKSLLGHMGRAIKDWNLIEDGDRIMVGLSGGKDSYALMHLLGVLRRRAPVDFSLIGVNLDQGHPGFEGWKIETWLKDNGFEYRMLKEDTYSIVTEKIPEGKTYCSLCSRLRRGILYDAAVELGCRKIALGHHRDDVIETLFLNLFFAGQLKAMPARLHSDDGRNVVVRPLAYAPEEELAEFAALMQFPILPCDLCGSQENLQRKQIKHLLASLQEKHPNLKSSILNALTNVRPTHLLDPKLAKDAPRSEGGTAPFEAGEKLAEALAPLLAGGIVKLPVLGAD
jgi:tRNA 2-thiocytidine biosynthesis protein TtcA